MSPALYIVLGLLCLAVALLGRRREDEDYFRWPVGPDEDVSNHASRKGRGRRPRRARARNRVR